MTELQCVTVLAHEDEAEATFKGRLSVFWTYMLRTYPDEFKLVYAEASEFEDTAGRLSRRYLVAASVTEHVQAQLRERNMPFLPAEPDDVYSVYEAVAPEWWQIEHK